MLVLIVAFVLAGCVGQSSKMPEHHRIDGVVRVFMHDTDHYTLWVADPDGTRMVSPLSITVYDDLKVYLDVPPGQHMWATYWGNDDLDWDYLGSYNAVPGLELHLRQPSDVLDAGTGGKHHHAGIPADGIIQGP